MQGGSGRNVVRRQHIDRINRTVGWLIGRACPSRPTRLADAFSIAFNQFHGRI